MLTLLLALLLTAQPQGKPKQATIVIAPATVTIPVGGMQIFAATTTGTTKLPVWSATGGSITQSGRYDAGTVPGIYLVTATLPANVKSTAIVTITPSLDTTAPTMPSNLTVSLLTQTSFDLGWNPAFDAVGVAGYGVYANGALADVAVGAGTSFAGLVCDAVTALGIDAFDAAGNRSQKALLSVRTLPCIVPPDTTPPSAPTNLTATPQQTTTGLTWAASTDAVGVVGYGIYLNGNLRQSATGTLATITGLQCGQTYVMAVDGVDLAGNRSVKASLTVQTLACAPPVVTATTLIFTVPTDYATNVTVCALELRPAGAAPTTTPIATRSLGKPAAVSGDVSVDISTLVDPLPSGSYYGIVVATGPGGSTPSLPSANFTK